jgi:4-hydroxythreonine-4-phosphate dehydrogenase
MEIGPRLLVTMGDVAGIGPEIIARAWPALTAMCCPVVVGDPGWLHRAIELVGLQATVQIIDSPDEARPEAAVIPCLKASAENLCAVQSGRVSAAAGRAAYDFLITAIDLTQAGAGSGIVTAPLHKEGLRAAGLAYPGHTEILAERTAARRYGMVLYVNHEARALARAEGQQARTRGLGVIHVTLHVALREIWRHLTIETVLEKTQLLDRLMSRMCGRKPRLGVAGLNPHASDGGLFGDEEASIIVPAVKAAQDAGLDVSGPWPSDTLFVRARQGDFDGVTAMYHDQGHIALKLLGGWSAVNITVGLPLIRTSVAHGTAYDIAGKGIADATSLIEAARVAAQLAGSE